MRPRLAERRRHPTTNLIVSYKKGDKAFHRDNAWVFTNAIADVESAIDVFAI